MAEILKFFGKQCLFLRRVVRTARCVLQVEKLGKGRPNYAVSMIANAHAQIDIVERNLQVLIQATNLEKHGSSNR